MGRDGREVPGLRWPRCLDYALRLSASHLNCLWPTIQVLSRGGPLESRQQAGCVSASEKSSFGLKPPGPIAYLTPEFPGQTHTWIWREIVHMREWGVDIRLFSTRRPDNESAARHAFAEQARNETVYLWPRSLGSIVAAVAWAARNTPSPFSSGSCDRADA